MIRSRRTGSRLTAYSPNQLAPAVSATRSPGRTSTPSSVSKGTTPATGAFSKPSSTGLGRRDSGQPSKDGFPSATRPQPPQVPWLNPGTGDLEAGRQQGVDDEEEDAMATEKQKQAARRNLTKARAAQSARAKGKRLPRRTQGLSTAEQNDLTASEFAFPETRKEPLTDAAHVRNAVARFDQVEGVSDRDRDKAWKRIKAAAKRFDVDVEADDWRELFAGGKARKR